MAKPREGGDQHSEAKPEERQQHFKRVFENSHDAIFIVDPKADAVIDVNPAACDMIGYSYEELLSFGPSDLHPDELDRFYAFVDGVYEDGDGWTDELTCLTRDRGRIPAEISASRITYDGRRVMLAVVRDISERKRHEHAQRRLYEITADPERSFDDKLQAVFDLGCEYFDMEIGGLARVDPATDLFEVEATNGEHDDLAPGERYPLSETYCQLATDGGQTATVTAPVERYEGKLCHDQFGVRAYLGTHLEFGDTADRTFWFVSTEPRDEAFSETERTFHYLMGEWVRKGLKRKQYEAQLQQKNDRLEDFASMLAHELRNPVQIGQIYSQQLPDETDTEAVDYVTEAFDRIEDMIDVMLILTRGREAVGTRSPVELGDVAREVWSEVDAPEATLEVAVDRTVGADETYIRHFFRNLFENAVEHGSASPRSQTREDADEHGSADVTVEVGDLPDADGFYVADDGVGILPENRDAVFDAGYTTASGQGGTGLGLAFVKKLADVYDWECAVTESTAGGARFEFRNVSRGS